MSPAGTSVCPDMCGINAHREGERHTCAQDLACVHEIFGLSLDPQSKWISKPEPDVWAQASLMCCIWCHESGPQESDRACFGPGQQSLADVEGRKLNWGQRSISETLRGVESLTTFLQVFWILLSREASSPNRQVSNCWEKPCHKLEPGLVPAISCPPSTDYVPCIVLSTLSFSPYNNLMWGRCYNYPHFIDGETEIPCSTADNLQSGNPTLVQWGSSCRYSWQDKIC